MIFIVSGPGGVGKGTLVEELVARDPNLWLSRSWTTRPKRDRESPDAYVFASDEDFDRHIAENGFLEWVEFLGNRYGTPVARHEPGIDVVLEIELQGAQRVRRSDPGAVLILIVPPSMDALEARLRRRGESESRIRERIEYGRHEMETGREVADVVVVNDDLETAIGTLAGVVSEYRKIDSLKLD